MVRTVFAEMQPFKRVKNYFTDSLLFRENGKVVKEPLPDDIDRGYKADSELRVNQVATFDEEPIVPYFNHFPKMMANGSLMKISIPIILCTLMMYIFLLV